MRKISVEVVGAFNNGQKKRMNNTESTGNELFLHGNKIAERKNGHVFITNAGWVTSTTKERLNMINGVNITQKNFVWYLNGKEWQGELIKI